MVNNMRKKHQDIQIIRSAGNPKTEYVTKEEVIRIILDSIHNTNIPISQVFFRGSIVTERHNIHDIDLLVVSDIFYGIDIVYRKKIIKNMFIVNYIDPICLTKIESKAFLNTLSEKVELIYECEY